MVNITVFGPWSGKKTATVDKAGVVNVSAGGMNGYDVDTEAHLLPLASNDTRWNRRGKFCCLAFIADICAFLALLLIIFSTGFLLWKVWWVKTEVDKMQPAVLSLSASLNRLQVESDALQAENNALINAYSSQTGNSYGSGDSDVQMEDTNSDSLSELAVQDSLGNRMDGTENRVVGMTVYMAIGKASPDSDTANFTEELEKLFDQAAQAADDNDDESDDDDSLPTLYPILDAGDNGIQTSSPAVTGESTTADQETTDFLAELRAPLIFGDKGDDEDDFSDDTPKRKSKDLDDGDSDDDEDDDDKIRSVPRVPSEADGVSDSD